MKKSFGIFLAILVVTIVGCVEKIDRPPAGSNANSKTYEMITYYLVLMRRGPNWTAEITPEVEKIQEAHLEHINAMARSGELVISGPFMDQTGDSALAGMFIYKVESKETARVLTESDPAVKAGRLTYEIYPWYGPSTLSY